MPVDASGARGAAAASIGPRWVSRAGRLRADRWGQLWARRTQSHACGDGSDRLRTLAKSRILRAEARRRVQRLADARRMVVGKAAAKPATSALRRALRDAPR